MVMILHCHVLDIFIVKLAFFTLCMFYVHCISFIWINGLDIILTSVIAYQQELFCDPECTIYNTLGMICTLSKGSSKLQIEALHMCIKL